jgi:hypothetical protein
MGTMGARTNGLLSNVKGLGTAGRTHGSFAEWPWPSDTECGLVFLSIIFYVPGKGPGTSDYGS